MGNSRGLPTRPPLPPSLPIRGWGREVNSTISSAQLRKNGKITSFTTPIIIIIRSVPDPPGPTYPPKLTPRFPRSRCTSFIHSKQQYSFGRATEITYTNTPYPRFVVGLGLAGSQTLSLRGAKGMWGGDEYMVWIRKI